MNLNTITKAIAGLTVILSGAFSYAGGCHLEDVTPAKELASEYLANLVRDKVVEVEKSMNAKGQKLNAVFIARRGESMSGLRIYKDDPNVALQDYLQELTKAIHAISNSQDRDAATGTSGSNQMMDRLFTKNQLKYSHMGILLKRNPAVPADQQPKDDWVYITHLLSECDKKSDRYGASDLFFQTLDQFFWDTKILSKKAYANSAMVIVPIPEVQARIREIFDHREIFRTGLHTLQYNVAAVPFRLKGPSNRKGVAPQNYYQLKDQNSNQWPLEVLAAATKPVGQIFDRTTAQDQLMATNYRPSILRPVGLKESLACSLKKGPFWDATNLLNCNDQAFRSVGIVQLITVDSVVDYMVRNSLTAESVDVANQPAIYEVTASADVIAEKIKEAKIIEDLIKTADQVEAEQNRH